MSTQLEPPTVRCQRIKQLVVISHKRHDRLPDGRIAVRGGFAKITSEFSRHVKTMTLCVPVGGQPETSEVSNYPGNITLSPLPMYGGHLSFVRQLPSIVRRLWREIGRADVVYAMAPNNMGVLGLVLARVRGKPVFLSIDTDRAGKARSAGGFRGRAKAWLVEKTIYTLLRRLGGSRPAFVTGDDFLGSRPHWRQWIKTTVTSSEVPPYRTPEPSKVLQVVFVGRLSPEKNIGSLIEAATLLEKEGYRIAVQIVGHGPQRDTLVKLKEERGVECVTFCGAVPNAELRETRFLGADVLVLPSREERQGKVLLEAMACSVPVIAARAGGIPSVVTDGFNGLLFNPDAPDELVRCLRRIAGDSNLRKTLTENGYRFALDNALDKSVRDIMNEVSAFYRISSQENRS
ncbi:glycosyltransferase [Thioalkalivibrio sp. ALMg13-2]|uniref:glycosyltransferase n=1 Tax=Thioalkalivibrio sp. ALMg13-2 TaxID=1158167 RepID=UPI0009DA26C8|nr:glycosyltransferase [Thioalkalivibrio sp. ALMg13-2]